MTTEELAIMIQGQFDNMQGQFDGIKTDLNIVKTDIVEIKEDQQDMKKEMSEMNGKIDDMLEVNDAVVKKQNEQDNEKIANTAAHDRFNSNFLKIKKNLSLDSVEAVESL